MLNKKYTKVESIIYVNEYNRNNKTLTNIERIDLMKRLMQTGQYKK